MHTVLHIGIKHVKFEMHLTLHRWKESLIILTNYVINETELFDTLNNCQPQLSQDFCQPLDESMTRHCQAVNDANGYPTKYQADINCLNLSNVINCSNKKFLCQLSKGVVSNTVYIELFGWSIQKNFRVSNFQIFKRKEKVHQRKAAANSNVLSICYNYILLIKNFCAK